jgi:hypothetical protein
MEELVGIFLLRLWVAAFVMVFAAAASASIMERETLSAVIWLALGALGLTLLSYA